MSTIKNSYEYYEGNQSLLNMLNKKTSGNPLINQIIVNNQNTYQKRMEAVGLYKNTTSDKYSKVTKATNSLLDSIENVTREELYNQEKGKEFDKAPLFKSISNFVAAYNNQITSLDACGGALNKEFLKEFQNSYLSNKINLNEVGITEEKDGKLIINQDILNKIPIDSIKKVFNENTDYIMAIKSCADSINDIMGKVQAMKSSNYNAKGLFY